MSEETTDQRAERLMNLLINQGFDVEGFAKALKKAGQEYEATYHTPHTHGHTHTVYVSPRVSGTSGDDRRRALRQKPEEKREGERE